MQKAAWHSGFGSLLCGVWYACVDFKIVPFVFMFSCMGTGLLMAQPLQEQMSRYYTYPQKVFDHDSCCWRQMSQSKNFQEAAMLIEGYLKHGPVVNRQALRWHAGQLYALGQQDQLAKKYMHQTYSIWYKWLGGMEGKTWYYYAKGTLAFLDGHQRRLQRIISRWDAKWPKDKNYATLVSLEAHWGEPYSSAVVW